MVGTDYRSALQTAAHRTRSGIDNGGVENQLRDIAQHSTELAALAACVCDV